MTALAATMKVLLTVINLVKNQIVVLAAIMTVKMMTTAATSLTLRKSKAAAENKKVCHRDTIHSMYKGDGVIPRRLF